MMKEVICSKFLVMFPKWWKTDGLEVNRDKDFIKK